MPIRFFEEDLSFRIKNKNSIKNWLKDAAAKEGAVLKDINIILCNDNFLLSLNKKFLSHNSFTDIVTFPGKNNRIDISGELYISLDRVLENAKKFNVPQEEELHRVIAHGILHLLGYRDKSPSSQAKMRKKEDLWLSLRSF